jgi:outer membrane protein OmpA-like peptidoglycan-associated protein
MKALGFASILLLTGSARADGWLEAEAPAAVAVSSVQDGVFRTGVMPAFGAYLDTGLIAAGLRVRAGVLRNGPAPGNNLKDPGVGGLGTGGVALRLHRGGGWVEGVAGLGVTGRDVVPAIEAGAGWMFRLGSVDVGPSIRYARIVSNDSMSAFGTAELVLIGADIQFAVGRDKPLPHVAPPPPPPPRIGPVESDHDRVDTEHEHSCATDPDGCVLAEGIVLHNDRIVLDDRVLFELNRAHVRSAGRELIARLAKIWKLHPEWKHVTIEGHCDTRGTDEYNQWLSEQRAQRTRDQFLKNGFTEDQLDAVGYGRTRPIDDGTSEEAHTRNRRVEFVIDRELTPDLLDIKELPQ